eukprot:52512_1
MKNTDEKQHDKYHIFDTQYNIENQINWNKLYEFYKDDGKVIPVNNEINKYIANHPNYKQILPNNMLAFIDKIAKKAKLAHESHTRSWTHNDWTNVVDNVDDISIWYRKEEGTDIHSLKLQNKMKCTPLDIIVVINEFDLLSTLISLIKVDIELIKEYSPVEKIMYSKGHLWFPLKNRDCVVQVEAFESLDEYGEIIIVGQSIDPNIDIDENDAKELNLRNEILGADSKTVRMDVHLSEGLLKPLKFGGNDNLTETICILNVDPKSYVPKWLLNWANRTFAFYVAKIIRHRCENLRGTEHAKRVATKPIYRKWKRDMLEYIQKAKEDENHILNRQVEVTSEKIPDQLNEDNDERKQEPAPEPPKLPANISVWKPKVSVDV